MLTPALYATRYCFAGPRFTGPKPNHDQPLFDAKDWFEQLGMSKPQMPLQASRWIKPHDKQPPILSDQAGKKQVQFNPYNKRWRVVEKINEIKPFKRP